MSETLFVLLAAICTPSLDLCREAEASKQIHRTQPQCATAALQTQAISPTDFVPLARCVPVEARNADQINTAKWFIAEDRSLQLAVQPDAHLRSAMLAVDGTQAEGPGHK